ncbi:hypothetical protein Taro_028614 [Colocasia esculenta]|uniref:Uncharacterized protein n=1 Tax=Colocasia esculenta TaxID=4460 RepID=A0A843VNN0_COLES|nr:hypothetical protein [Colocasia esculenta]
MAFFIRQQVDCRLHLQKATSNVSPSAYVYLTGHNVRYRPQIDELFPLMNSSSKGIQDGTNIYCKGGVDTPHTGVDTIFQALSQNMKNWSTSVDTRPGQVDTRGRSQRILFIGLFSQVDTKCRQVDTRWLSQKACFSDG